MCLQIRNKVTPKTWFYIFSCILLIGVVNNFIIFPILIEKGVSDLIELREDSFMRKIWEKYPFYVEFKIYIMNITNPDEVTRGEIPIMEEIGPYYFE